MGGSTCVFAGQGGERNSNFGRINGVYGYRRIHTHCRFTLLRSITIRGVCSTKRLKAVLSSGCMCGGACGVGYGKYIFYKYIISCIHFFFVPVLFATYVPTSLASEDYKEARLVFFPSFFTSLLSQSVVHEEGIKVVGFAVERQSSARVSLVVLRHGKGLTLRGRVSVGWGCVVGHLTRLELFAGDKGEGVCGRKEGQGRKKEERKEEWHRREREEEVKGTQRTGES